MLLAYRYSKAAPVLLAATLVLVHPVGPMLGVFVIRLLDGQIALSEPICYSLFWKALVLTVRLARRAFLPLL